MRKSERERNREGRVKREREREGVRCRVGVGQLKLAAAPTFGVQVQRAYKKQKNSREEKLLARLAMSLGKIKYTPRGP